MVVYEVNISLSPEIKEDFLKWLPSHIDEILAFPGFKSAKNFTEHEHEHEHESSNHRLIVHYYLNNLEALQSYFENHSQRLKQQTLDRFGNNFSATRRILGPANILPG